MLRLVTCAPKADVLLPFVKSLFDMKKLTQRQCNVWFMTEIQGKTVWEISQETGTPRRTVEREQQRARAALDAAWTAEQESEDGETRFAVVVCHGHEAHFSTDTTALLAHRRCGFGLAGRAEVGLARAA